MNPYFRAPPDSALYEEEAFGAARAEFFEVRDRFVDRLVCAQFFDAERFEAMLLWLGVLKRFHEANAEPVPATYFAPAALITNHLEIQSRYSKTQQTVCAAASAKWTRTVEQFTISEERGPNQSALPTPV